MNIGLIRDIFGIPITYGLEHSTIPHAFRTHFAPLAENAQKLSSGEIDIGLVSPIEYARSSETWEILRGIGIASYGLTRAACLHFKQGISRIQTISTDLAFPTEMVVTQIIFLEKFGYKPSFIPLRPGATPVASDTDAALLVGDAALDNPGKGWSLLDLGDEWNDLTGLPLVHAVVAGRRDSIDRVAASSLIHSYAYFNANRDEIIGKVSEKSGVPAGQLQQQLHEEIRYSLDEDDLDGIRELFRHCYYHSMLEDIPDLHFSKVLPSLSASMN